MSLSQSSELFKQQEKKLQLLLMNIDSDESVSYLQKLNEKYFHNVGEIKYQIKFKIEKYEKAYQNWTDFEKISKRFSRIFEYKSYFISHVEVNSSINL